MDLMELQRRYGQLREAFAVTLGKHKERILVYLEEIQKLQLEVEQDTSQTMSKTREELELCVTETVERSCLERAKAHAELSCLVEEVEEIEYLMMRVARTEDQ
ncbi:uncharacterized protein LOC133733813 isoform X2 [Rosa rugosa]|uniref:uncharacterized protein LOC133733813 isoform X2 n=1 Tax=Rosa rugosa TaxID=74645 RepID=UPI002B414DD6|nr:uncharacterized protein LOC133733813 isoform X2 [Rosa rugosa]